MAEVTVEHVVAEVKRHHPNIGFMVSPNHHGYQTWGAYCRSHYDNPDTDCEYNEWGWESKGSAKAAWYRHVAEAVAEAVVAVVSGNEIAPDKGQTGEDDG